jgi:hypothetical protein
VNLKLTSACAIAGVMALAIPFRALTAVAATANPSSTSDGAGDNSNPYSIIIDRNVFRLNPPPPPPSAEKKPVELPKVYLNGIFKVGDDVRVLFSIPPKDAKGQTTYFKLAPGEKDGVLELVGIHPDQQEVDVLVSDTAMTLSVLSNSLASAGGKSGGGGTSSGPAAAPHGGTSAIIAGGSRDSSPYGDVTVAGGGVTTIGGGNSTSFGGGSGGVSVAGGGGGGVSPTSFGGGVSVAGGAGTPGQTQTANTPTAPLIPPEQQPLMLAAQFVQAQQQGIPLPPLPPDLQQMINGEESSGTTSLPSLPPLPRK